MRRRDGLEAADAAEDGGIVHGATSIVVDALKLLERGVDHAAKLVEVVVEGASAAEAFLHRPAGAAEGESEAVDAPDGLLDHDPVLESGTARARLLHQIGRAHV